MAALKGKGKGKGKKGKQGKGYYKGGQGKGKNNWYRAPGKAIGKGSINYNGAEDDYWNAWGYEGEGWNYDSNYDYGDDYGNYYLGNVMMMLEADAGTTDDRPNDNTTTTDTTIPDMTKFTVAARDVLRGHNYSTIYYNTQQIQCPTKWGGQ